MFKHILVPLDGSKLAEQALPYAESLATQYGAKLLLLRVIPQLGVPAAPLNVAAAMRNPAMALPCLIEVSIAPQRVYRAHQGGQGCRAWVTGQWCGTCSPALSGRCRAGLGVTGAPRSRRRAAPGRPAPAIVRKVMSARPTRSLPTSLPVGHVSSSSAPSPLRWQCQSVTAIVTTPTSAYERP